MKQPKQTAISVAAMQLVLMIGVAQAQTADESKPQTLDTVTVTGQRAALQSAQKRKQDAEEIIDAVTADEAGKLPDRSITEVLQRVVGVTVQRQRNIQDDAFHFSEEGSGIRVRGLKWGASNLNGREIFSAGWPGKDLSWGAVPTELMVGVDTYKNPSAERIEGAISGMIDLRTGMPFDYKPNTAKAAFGVDYSTSSKKTSPRVSALYSTYWDTEFGRVGVLADVASNLSVYGSDSLSLGPYYPRTNVLAGQTVWAPSGMTWGSSTGETRRDGFYGALQWRKNDMESGLTYFISKGHDTDKGTNFYSSMENVYQSVITDAEVDDRGIVVKGHYTYPGMKQTGVDKDGKPTYTSAYGYGPNQFAAGGIAMGNSRFYNVNDTTTGELAWNFKWKLNDRWSVQNDLQWVNSKFETTGRQIQLGTFLPSIDVDTSKGGPVQLNFDQTTRDFLANPNNYYLNIIQPKLYKGDSNLYAWKADARYNFEDPVLRDLRFGVRVTERHSVRKEASYASDPGGTGWKSLAEPWAVAQTTVAGTEPTGNGRGNFSYLGAPGYYNNFTVPTELFNYSNLLGGRMGNLPDVIFPTFDYIRDLRSYGEAVQQAKFQQCNDTFRNRPASENTCKFSDYAFDTTLLYDQAPARTARAKMRTAALYGNLRFGFDDWKIPVEGNAGVRAVYTSVVSHGHISFDTSKTYDNAPASLPRFTSRNEPLDVTDSHVDLLPSLNLKANFTDKLQGRIAMARSIYRPDFKQLQETITLKQDYNAGANAATYTGDNSGNAKLRPLKADSFDVSLEWYPKRGQSLTAVAFYKRVKDIIYNSTYTRNYDTVDGQPQTFVITGPANLAKANLRGIELSGDTYLDHFDFLKDVLPTWAKGFGVSANYTYIDHDQKFYRDGSFTYCPTGEVKNSAMQIYGCDTNGLPFKNKLPLEGVVKNAANFALRYDGEGWSLRLAYNWNSRSLLGLDAGGTQCYDNYCPGGTSADPARAGKTDTWYGLPRWQEAYGQWDLGGGYTFSNKFSVNFSISNLNKVTVRETYQQNGGVVGHAWKFPGQTYSLSGNMEF